MSNVALLLGHIAFQDFEVPATINIGGDQRLAIHRLLGGTRNHRRAGAGGVRH